MKIRYTLVAISILFTSLAFGQVTFESNVPLATRYVGFDNNSGIVLPIENRGFPDIKISSNSSNKFAITEQGIWNGLNGLSRTDVQRTTLGLQGQTNLAWSMLHLWDDAAGNVPTALQRPWMNVGTSYSSNTDFMYSGIMERPVAGGGNLQTDAVMAWGRNNSLAEPDNMRFIFITPEQQGTAAGSEQGLEIMRLTPTGNVGIGNFTDTPFGIGGGYGQPQSPLDVQFQGAIPDGTNNIAVNVVNNTWDDPVPTEKIGINSESFANLEAGFVIGGKFLGVRGYKSAGVWAEGIGGSEGGNGQTYGLVASAVTNDFDARHYGVYASARFAVENIGIYAEGFSNNGLFAAGVHGHTQMQQNSWGGFFDGQTFCTLGTWSASDESIKEDVTEIENALDLILELNPKKYRFNQNVSELVLDDDYHYGFLAQELEEVIPELVRDFVSPSRNDTSGNPIASSAEFKAVQYEGIIPILVEAFKIQNTTYAEQQELIQEQDSTIAALENALATQTASIQNLQDQMENVLVQVDVMQQKTSNCCQNQDGSPGNLQDGKNEDTGMMLEQNAPNPFDEQTRIAFTLASNSKVKLLITNSTGQTVETLANGAFSSGRHEVTWNASGQAPGVYYYTLYVDGELMTKKMIKL